MFGFILCDETTLIPSKQQIINKKNFDFNNFIICIFQNTAENNGFDFILKLNTENCSKLGWIMVL